MAVWGLWSLEGKRLISLDPRTSCFSFLSQENGARTRRRDGDPPEGEVVYRREGLLADVAPSIPPWLVCSYPVNAL